MKTLYESILSKDYDMAMPELQSNETLNLASLLMMSTWTDITSMGGVGWGNLHAAISTDSILLAKIRRTLEKMKLPKDVQSNTVSYINDIASGTSRREGTAKIRIYRRLDNGRWKLYDIAQDRARGGAWLPGSCMITISTADSRHPQTAAAKKGEFSIPQEMLDWIDWFIKLKGFERR